MTTEKDDKYVSVSLLVSGLSIALVLILGWLFNVMAESNRRMTDRQTIAHVRSAINETEIINVQRRISDLEEHEYETIRGSKNVR